MTIGFWPLIFTSVSSTVWRTSPGSFVPSRCRPMLTLMVMLLSRGQHRVRQRELLAHGRVDLVLEQGLQAMPGSGPTGVESSCAPSSAATLGLPSVACRRRVVNSIRLAMIQTRLLKNALYQSGRSGVAGENASLRRSALLLRVLLLDILLGVVRAEGARRSCRRGRGARSLLPSAFCLKHARQLAVLLSTGLTFEMWTGAHPL